MKSFQTLLSMPRICHAKLQNAHIKTYPVGQHRVTILLRKKKAPCVCTTGDLSQQQFRRNIYAAASCWRNVFKSLSAPFTFQWHFVINAYSVISYQVHWGPLKGSFQGSFSQQRLVHFLFSQAHKKQCPLPNAESVLSSPHSHVIKEMLKACESNDRHAVVLGAKSVNCVSLHSIVLIGAPETIRLMHAERWCRSRISCYLYRIYYGTPGWNSHCAHTRTVTWSAKQTRLICVWFLISWIIWAIDGTC